MWLGGDGDGYVRDLFDRDCVRPEVHVLLDDREVTSTVNRSLGVSRTKWREEVIRMAGRWWIHPMTGEEEYEPDDS